MAAPPDRSRDEGALQTLKREVGLERDSLTLERAFRYADARMFWRLDRLEDARDAFLRLAQLDADEPWVYWDLAEVHKALGAFHEAGLAYLTAADKHLARGETDRVLEAYQQAGAVSPNDPEVQAKLAGPAPAAPPPAAPASEPAGPASALPPTATPPAAPPPPATPDAEPHPRGKGKAARERAATARGNRVRTTTETLGQILLQHGFITQQQLDEALAIQTRTGERIGKILRDTGAVTEVELAKGMASQWGYTYQALDD
ncbi:MAG: hypothetical protein QN174_06675, partial [Armatimonadota bacterium]|nr:hypothetical protein [Armatimonadota bacterium]